VPVGVGIAVADSGGGNGNHQQSGMMSEAGNRQGRNMDNGDRQAMHDQMREHQGAMDGSGSGMQRGATTTPTTPTS